MKYHNIDPSILQDHKFSFPLSFSSNDNHLSEIVIGVYEEQDGYYTDFVVSGLAEYPLSNFTHVALVPKNNMSLEERLRFVVEDYILEGGGNCNLSGKWIGRSGEQCIDIRK